MNMNLQAMNPYWQKNIESLASRYPRLVQQLKTVDPANRFITAQTGKGYPLLGVRLPHGQVAPLCHPETPQQEADQWVLGLGESMRKRAHVLLLGFGAGYHPLALFCHSDAESVIWVVEPDPALFKAALHLMDFTSLLSSPRIRLAVGLSEKETAEQLFHGPSGHRMRAGGIQMVFTGVSKVLYADYIDRLRNAIEEAIAMERLRFKTSELQGRVILNHVMENLPYIIQGAPVKRLAGSTPGVPALILAPGPSLEEALPFLLPYHDKALCIAVDTAHRILLQQQFQSDVVVSLDFTELNKRHFEGMENDPAILLAFPGIHPSISKRYQGRTFFYDHVSTIHYDPGATPLFRSLLSFPSLGNIISYGSTSHAAVHAARMMGCSPILLVGNDLAFPQDRWYARGAMQYSLEQPERETEELLPVPSHDGGTVQTSGLYKYYLDTFSELISGLSAPVINTSPHGARIEGCRWMELEEALSTYCTTQVDKTFLEKSLHPSLQICQPQLIEDLQDLAESCCRTRKLLRRLIDRLTGISPSSSSFRQDMIQLMKSFADLLQRESRALNVCTSLCSRSTLLLLGQSGSSSLFGGDSSGANQESQQRCLTFLKDMEQALQLYAEVLLRAVPTLSP